MQTQGYMRPTRGDGTRSEIGVLFTERLINQGTGEPFQGQDELVLRSEADAAIAAAGNPETIAALQAQIVSLNARSRGWENAAAEHSARADRMKQERDGWEHSAALFSRGQDYYQGQVRKCGEAIGKEAYTADDGFVGDDVLAEKVPELVQRLVNDTRGSRLMRALRILLTGK